MSPEPRFSGNDFTYFSELNNSIKNTEPLWYTIPYEHKVIIKSKDIFYWPRAEVVFNPNNSGTSVTIRFIGTVFAYIVYGIFLAVYIGLLAFLAIHRPSELLPVLVFVIPLALIPVFFRWIQNNIVGRLQYS
ncbi:hypothetical protein LVD15_26250 [Fulvivirga maritima]|uniref:hypothetical protein n=1 Tax=Fulvivirga maritima TaxID=2904247 RepID=UPI001F219108|nr:hypothetical protein [Fulvivirga maritima]UII26756.1 hypothetical protein LVD15_26250 [Fulvivirga maritima]